MNCIVKKSSANQCISRVGSLYEMFYLENKDDVDGIIMKPFSKITKTKNKHERQEKALERELD